MTYLENPRTRLAVFFGFLLLVDWYLYFWDIGHFFQADTMFLLYHRPTSVTEFLREFIKTHPSGWYRPLANEIIEPIFYPLLGLNPAIYRIPVYAVFIADTIAVYALALAITRRQLPAAIATLFFNIHTTNAFTTYDAGYLPELLYTFFFIASALAYWRYLEHRTRLALGISLACFACALLSKEAAATLPFVLVALHIFKGFTSRKQLLAAGGHFVVLGCYLAFAVGYLHVQGVAFDTVLNPPSAKPTGGYQLILGKTILENADYGTSWMFNIPRGWMTDDRHLEAGMVSFLKFFRALVVVIAAFLLLKRERKVVLLGTAWFLITLGPTLPLLNHFLPYYLFLPIAGFSLVIGTVFAWLYDNIRRFQPAAAAATIVVLLGGLLYVCGASIHADIRDHMWLGGSARLARSSLDDLKRLYPALPSNGTIYINDDEEPLAWHHSSGGLIKMAYNTKDVAVFYSSAGDAIPEGVPADKLILLRFQNKRLLDATDVFITDARGFGPYNNSGAHTLRISRSEVGVGDSFALEISGFRDAPVELTYTFNEGRVQLFQTILDHQGRAKFDVSEATPKGSYHFLGFKVMGEPDWFRADAAITVR